MQFIKLILIILLVFTAGCADITPPMPSDIIKNPLGSDSVKIGMTKDHIRDLWGEPNQINFVKKTERWSGEREEWVYKAKYSSLPFSAGYLSKTKRLYFDGKNLTHIMDEK